MKQLIRRFSRVSDSSQYCILRSSEIESNRPASRTESFRAKLRRRASSSAAMEVPSGHVPVYVGEEMERFVVAAEILNHPLFVQLLETFSAGEYGYEQQGVLRIPCHVTVFERVLDALRFSHSHAARDLRDLLAAADCSSYGVVSA